VLEFAGKRAPITLTERAAFEFFEKEIM